MNENFFEKITPEDKKRLAYIEGRPDLFETKLYAIPTLSQIEAEKKLLVATRDPGSGNALLPVIKELAGDAGVKINILTDGRAQEIIQKNLKLEDITPEKMILEADKVIGQPQAILMDRSTSEMGVDTYVDATFPEVPKILVEDYYTNSINFLGELMERNLPLPEKICVMDQGAKEIIVKKFPQLKNRIEVTGQPAFDRFVGENTRELAKEVKQKLGLQETDKLVAYMSTLDEPEKIRQMAAALKDEVGDFYFVFRRHPRDNVDYDTYKKILTEQGIRVVDTDAFSTDEIGAAADVIITTWSTEGLHGIYRRKPTVHVIDPDFRIPKNLDLPLVPVKLGASVGLEKMGQLSRVLPQLLDTDSSLNVSMKTNMEKYYPADGQNARRVANVVRGFM